MSKQTQAVPKLHHSGAGELTAGKFNLLTADDVRALCGVRHDATELVLTGMGASDALISRADLVTEMKEIKHYYQAGVTPRKGIED